MSHKTLQLYISRLMSLLLCLTLVFFYAPLVQAEGESGSCGSDLQWSYSAGTLTVSGSGDMADYTDPDSIPWYPYRQEIVRLKLPSGLSSVGDMAFYNCNNLTAVVIPDSVTEVGQFAFAMCSNLQILKIGSGVRTIGEAAFSECYKVTSLDLPEGLKSIGTKGFYRCETITSVRVPSTVSSMGVSVFAYCKNLVTAHILAPLKTLPDYMFYGCERLAAVTLPVTTKDVGSHSFRGCDELSTVHYGGSDQDVSELYSAIGSEVQKFGATGAVTQEPSGGSSVTSGSLWMDQDGNYNQDNVTVTTGENSSVSSKVENTYQPDGTHIGSSAEVNVNINNEQGWKEVQDTVEQELDKVTEKTENITVNIFVKDTDEIDSDLIDSIGEKNVTVTVTTSNGSSWVVDAEQWGKSELSGDYNLSHTVTAGSEELSNELGGYSCFRLVFSKSAVVNSEVLIHLGNSWAHQAATLLQRDQDGLRKIQTTIVDRDGYAHFYLASVDADTEYAIGINLPREENSPAPIVPEIKQTGSTNMVNYNPIQYEITGRSSSWGMGLGQVMGILAVVMISVIVVVGAVMFAWNKRRLKNGYVPDWDDDDDYE